ncbi:MAG TPA: L,D-transpeptidase family protein [Marinobacter sp.]|nr:L,D-transpeptidase family protein [Marinobacter sp.]
MSLGRLSVLCSLLLTLLVHQAFASEVLARADTRLPVPHLSDIEQLPFITKVLVQKGERSLQLLSGEQIIRQYRISLGDNPQGHKLYEGDSRTPEGTYSLDWRNADSSFYKSIHISYPSAKDRELAKNWGLDPGGSIMIHGLPNGTDDDFAFAFFGLDWTDGCIAVSNQEIDEIWQLVGDGTPIEILP